MIDVLFMLVLGMATLQNDRVAALEADVQRHPTAAGVHDLAQAYIDAGQYRKGSDAYMRASAMYTKLGDPNAAKVLSDLAGRYRTTIAVFVSQPTDATHGSSPYLAKFEPAYGCYLGANIEREDSTRDPQTFNDQIGKHHAIFFMYRKYGVDFPVDYARQLRKARCALQLAFEPGDLSEVQDDEYLRRFADDARESKIPVFLRYASEMNGDWTPYHADPALYREKFRLVANVMRERAPNVAMVWCPNEIPEGPIPQYFPGDDVVDWVGVNFYSVIFNDADRSRGAEWRHPEDALDYVYRHYADKHPIMVGEWAASHLSVVDHLERPDFAETKIAQFYASIPLLYPRVKAVSWLSFNTFKYANEGRQLNDYSLFDNPRVADAYTKAVSDPYYLAELDDVASTHPVPLVSGMRLHPGDQLVGYIRSYEPSPTVNFLLDATSLTKITGPGPYALTLSAPAAGVHALKVQVKDHLGRTAATFSLPVVI